MRNLTLSLPDDVYRAARIRAAEHGTSVSALVSEYLRGLSGAEADFKRLQALQREVAARNPDFGGSERLPRDELYDRGVR